MDQELFARFSRAVEVLSVSEDQVTPEARFGDDLDADSLDLVELVMKCSKKSSVSKFPKQNSKESKPSDRPTIWWPANSAKAVSRRYRRHRSWRCCALRCRQRSVFEWSSRAWTR